MMPRLSWGTGITLVYSAFALGTIGTVAFAVAHPVDLVGANYYQDSTAYDARIAAIERADAAGMTIDIDLARNDRVLRVTLPPTQAATAAGTITLYRPSAADGDRIVPLTVDAGGHGVLSLRDLAPGVWRVRVDWTASREHFYREQLVHLP